MKLLVNDLNRRITIQQKQTVVDPEGIPTESWVDVATVWAAREPLVAGAREFFSAAAVNAEKTVRYAIRYRPGIFSNMRLFDKRDGLTYEIKAVLDDVFGDRTQTHIMAEVLTDG
ncbi:phage head closure protein [Brevibacillus borstelensis]|uniref:phage head closure protein n=1 Tax=Brevibacillus borstelensis TaxID=45462 RepID=UPI00204166BA|nr:phage head closure protein [Brevibacillus borstelensis]MCM3589630.1 phage head closure protein [Brevibacillus borstelensis]